MINTVYLPINCVFRSKNTVHWKTLLLNSINTVYRPINFVFSIEKHSFSAINRVYQRQMYYNISKNYVFRLINIVFRDKLCFSSEKLCFSIEKHCSSPINSVSFDYIQIFPSQFLIFFFFYRKITSVTQRSVSQENNHKKSLRYHKWVHFAHRLQCSVLLPWI